MPNPPADWLSRYQPWRRFAEAGFWVAILCAEVVINTIVSWLDLRRGDPGFPFWLPLLLELTSTVVVGALIPAIVAFERRFPLRLAGLRRGLAWHLLGTVLFCLAHVAGMVLLRRAVFAVLGRSYRVGDWGTMLGYEYLKDVRSYVAILAAVLVYRFVLLRMQGEARVLDATEPAAGEVPPPPETPARPERFLVRKLRKEFLIAAADIEWLQAQGNYVGLHVNGHDYLLRSTLADFLEQLDPTRFARVHRSYAVNRDRIAEIEPTDGGDAKLKMKDGSTVPCSRRYRDALPN